ncbi:MAG: hypothetical protein J3Q66DRAFT_326137 [Benniella sp.]|nr:MAG: hypothetical protein J3Q66DRAFT_326137 [Benniella sp.]
MASIVVKTESVPTIHTALTAAALKEMTLSRNTTAVSPYHDGPLSPSLFSPLAATTSAPSSDDGEDDDDEDDCDSLSGKIETVQVVDTAPCDATAGSIAQNDKVPATAAVAVTAPLSFLKGEQPFSNKEKDQKDVALKANQDAPVSITTTTRTTTDKSEEEPPKSPTRQELLRRSSLFNTKQITISNMRYSSTVSSFRPVADPRFKNRFQNILAQWKERDGTN